MSEAAYKEIVNIFNTIKKKNTSIKKKLNLHEPFFNYDETQEIKNCLKSTFVSSSGSFINKFSNKIKNITKAKYVETLINGTAAIHLSLIALGLRKNQEVLMPTLNYIASANATRYLDGIPHFIDSEEKTLGVDAKKLEFYLNKNTKIANNNCVNKKTGNIIKILIVTHVFGHPAEIDKLLKIARKFHIKVIEDASECLGSYYKKKHLGIYGDIGVLSFNGNKIITCGNGGAIITNNKKYFNKISHLSKISKKKHPWNYDYNEVGYNYKLSNINAALGFAQFKKLKKYIINKRLTFKIYERYFAKYKFGYIKKEPKYSRSNYWLQTLVLFKSNLKMRNKIIDLLQKRRVKVRPVWKLIHKIKHFSKFPRMNLDQSIKLEKKIINLPSSSNLKIK